MKDWINKYCFAMKMYSKRRKNKLKMIEENLEVEQNT